MTTTVLAAALLLDANRTHAGFTETLCLQNRYKVAGKYALCEQRTLGRNFHFDALDPGSDFDRALFNCRTKYTGTWAKLQTAASGTGTTCENARFEDNGDGTVTDRLTGLQWEQKTNDASVHNKDTTYTWTDTADADDTNADGTAYTSFLATLNGGGCFAGQCDWRLPTMPELQTILTEPCTTSPCIDEGTFGPTAESYYWSSSTFAFNIKMVWGVSFASGKVSNFAFKSSAAPARAVRGGL